MAEKKESKWEIWKDAKGQYRWKHTAANGKRIGASSEGYKRKIDCVANAKEHGYKA